MSPSDVTTDNELDLLRDMHNISVPSDPDQSFRVGDRVRIAMTRRPCKIRYTEQWSEELFVVPQKLCIITTTYMVKDLVVEPIDGTFYHQKLQLIRVELDTIYTVEHVLKKREHVEKIEYFVKWKAYGDTFTTWIIKEDVMDQLYIRLPSNSSINIYPENRASSYVTKLSDEIHLTGRWEIGPLSWFNMKSVSVTLP